MKHPTFNKARAGLAVLVLLEVLLLAAQFALFRFRTDPMTLTPGEGLSTYSADARITEAGLSNQGVSGKFAATRWLALRGGQYRFTVHYSADSDGAMYPYQNLALSNGEAAMPAGQTSASITVWLPQRVDNFQLHFLAGEGNMTITALDVVPLNNHAVLLAELLLFLLADGAVLLFCNGVVRIPPRRAQIILLLAAIAAFACAPLLHTMLMRGDDIIYHLHRIEGLAEELRLGTPLPIYLQSDWFDGQGYATSVFYCDLFLYLPALLRNAGLPLQSCYQTYLALVNLATVLTAWWSFRHMSGRELTGLLGCLLYTLSPYRLVNLYVRAAVGEATAMVFLPLIAAGLWDLYTLDTGDARYRTCWFPLAAGMWGCVMSHLLSTVMYGTCVFLVCVLFLRRTLRRETLLGFCKAAGAAAAASLGYLVPLLDYMKRGGFNVTGERGIVQLQYTGAEPGQLLMTFVSGEGTGKSLVEGIFGEMPLTAGMALLLGLLGFLLYALGHKEQPRPSLLLRAGRGAALAACIAMGVCLWVFPWDRVAHIPLVGGVLTMIQFPWRWLGIACLLLVFVCCVLVAELAPSKRWQTAAAAALVLVCAVEAGYTMSTAVNGRTPMRVCDLNALDVYNCGSGEYLPEVVGSNLYRGTLPEQPQSGQAVLGGWQRSGTNCTVRAAAGQESTVTVPLLYYPYYTAQDGNGGVLPVSCGENGQVAVTLPAGFDGEFTVRYAPPWYWYASAWLSLAAVLALVLKKVGGFLPSHAVQKEKIGV